MKQTSEGAVILEVGEALPSSVARRASYRRGIRFGAREGIRRQVRGVLKSVYSTMAIGETQSKPSAQRLERKPK
jgi:hypothetical protein